MEIMIKTRTDGYVLGTHFEFTRTMTTRDLLIKFFRFVNDQTTSDTFKNICEKYVTMQINGHNDEAIADALIGVEFIKFYFDDAVRTEFKFPNAEACEIESYTRLYQDLEFNEDKKSVLTALISNDPYINLDEIALKLDTYLAVGDEDDIDEYVKKELIAEHSINDTVQEFIDWADFIEDTIETEYEIVEGTYHSVLFSKYHCVTSSKGVNNE